MKKSITVKPKRGRPPTGRDPFVGLRLPTQLLEEIQSWSDKHKTQTRSEAVRRLLQLGLTVKTMVKPPSTDRANRAKELATKTIEKIIDPAAAPEERAQRRRHLTKGPLEFRQDRVDLPKTKR
jgi:Arc/MetJ-type ribon-helix-helix transcriptional regulator